MMKTIQMTINDDLLEQVDETSRQLGMSRSAFMREAMRQAMAAYKISILERQHAEGYARKPVEPGEFDVWDAEQVWGDS